MSVHLITLVSRFRRQTKALFTPGSNMLDWITNGQLWVQVWLYPGHLNDILRSNHSDIIWGHIWPRSIMHVCAIVSWATLNSDWADLFCIGRNRFEVQHHYVKVQKKKPLRTGTGFLSMEYACNMLSNYCVGWGICFVHTEHIKSRKVRAVYLWSGLSWHMSLPGVTGPKGECWWVTRFLLSSFLLSKTSVFCDSSSLVLASQIFPSNKNYQFFILQDFQSCLLHVWKL